MDKRKEAIEIFLAGVDSVKPDNLIKRFVSVENNNLRIDELIIDLSTIRNIYVLLVPGRPVLQWLKPLNIFWDQG